jgi:hypothetical protein
MTVQFELAACLGDHVLGMPTCMLEKVEREDQRMPVS